MRIDPVTHPQNPLGLKPRHGGSERYPRTTTTTCVYSSHYTMPYTPTVNSNPQPKADPVRIRIHPCHLHSVYQCTNSSRKSTSDVKRAFPRVDVIIEHPCPVFEVAEEALHQRSYVAQRFGARGCGTQLGALSHATMDPYP